MKQAGIFLADGFEEVEALAVVDVLRRGGVNVTMVSITGALLVQGAHGIGIMADCLYGQKDPGDMDMLILPGGKKGTEYLSHYTPLLNLLREFYEEEKYIAAICAAPSIFASLGFLRKREATSYPTFEKTLTGAKVVQKPAVVSGHVITGRAMGTAVEFGLTLLAQLQGKEAAKKTGVEIVFESATWPQA